MKVYYLSLREDTPKKDFWDYGFLYDLLRGLRCEEVSSIPVVKKPQNYAIVVIPARSHESLINEVNRELSKLSGVVLMLMGDEEGQFPVEKINHKNIRIWVQNPQPSRHDSFRKLGTGYTPKMHEYKPNTSTKALDWFFSGQVTHSRREECAEQLRDMDNGFLLESKGFTQGLEHKEYHEKMAEAKVCPCPSGPKTPDSFRLFESLELGCVPVADTQTPTEDWAGFWEWLFGEPVPFPTISDWSDLRGYTEDCVNLYPAINNDVQAWWMRYKNKMTRALVEDVRAVGGVIHTGNVTFIVPVSPIPSHPDFSILEETIESIRYHYKYADIFVTFDGVREEQKDRTDDYNEHIRRFLWKYCNDLGIRPYIFKEHMHQVGMAKAIIEEIETPLILYVEQDTPLVIDEPFEWQKIENFVLRGESNLVRFHFEGVIPEAHKDLVIGEPEGGFLKTVQWSQRPHLSSTAFYKRILSENFSKNSKCFIEDYMHGVVMQSWRHYGIQGWNQWRIHIYHPEGNIKRSYHTDGRAGSNKFDDTQIW